MRSETGHDVWLLITRVSDEIRRHQNMNQPLFDARPLLTPNPSSCRVLPCVPGRSGRCESITTSNCEPHVQLNTFHSGTYATFEHSVDNKINFNTYPEDFTIFHDDDTCFRSGTDPVC